MNEYEGVSSFSKVPSKMSEYIKMSKRTRNLQKVKKIQTLYNPRRNAFDETDKGD